MRDIMLVDDGGGMTSFGALDILSGVGSSKDAKDSQTPVVTPTTALGAGADKAGGTVNTTLTPEQLTNLNTAQIESGTVTSTAATTTPVVTTTFPAAGTFLGWDYQNNTKTSGTLRRKIIADGKGGQKIDFGSAEKNPDYVLGSRSFGPNTTATTASTSATTAATVATVTTHAGYWTDPTTGLLYNSGVLVEGDYKGYKYVGGRVMGNSTNPDVGGNYAGSGTASDPFTLNGKPVTGTMFGSTYKDGVIVDTAAMTAADIAKQARLAANVEYANTMKGLGLPQDLIDELDNLIKNDFTKAQMYLELIKSPAYKARFPGMDALRAAGKAVDEGTYINMEKGFLQTLQYYGIDKNIFGTTAEMGKYIGGLTSPKEFEDRVSIAAQDVEKNPDVLAELNLYYGIDKSAAITYLLNPTVGLDLIKRQARAAEIGAQASKSKFDFGQTAAGYGVAESFINAAGTMDLATLDVTFQQSRQLASNQGKLAAIEGQKYDDLNAVTAILGKDQAAILESQRRAAREAARFGGGSGLGAGSLKSESAI